MKLSSRKQLLKEAEEELNKIREAGGISISTDKLDPAVAKVARDMIKTGDDVKKMKSTIDEFIEKTNTKLIELNKKFTNLLVGKKYYHAGLHGAEPDEISYIHSYVDLSEGDVSGVTIGVNFKNGREQEFGLVEFFKFVLPKIR